MTPRLLKTEHATFALLPWDGVNRSGIYPLGDKVLVLVDVPPAKLGSIDLPNELRERHALASTTGVLVAVGEMAWTWNGARTTKWDGPRPEPGIRVAFTRYAGQEYTGLDGKLYRLLDDMTIGGVMGDARAEEKAA